MSRETVNDAIMRHHNRGMGQTELERIYGAEPVRRLLGTSPRTEARLPFARRLAAARAKAGKTPLEVAAYLGIRPDHYICFEEGLRRPSSPALIGRIAAFMGESADALADEMDEDLAA